MSDDVQDAVGSELLFENEKVRVWDLQLQPGQRLGMHRHKNEYVLIFVGDGKLHSINADGTTRFVQETHDGQVFYRKFEGDEDVHDAQNVGETPSRNFIIELKSD